MGAMGALAEKNFILKVLQEKIIKHMEKFYKRSPPTILNPNEVPGQ